MTTARIDTRFSTFLQGQQVDPAARNRLVTSAGAAAVALAIAGAFGWTADKLGMRTVDAPTVQYAVMLSFDPPPPPPVKPPPAIRSGAKTNQGGAPPEEPVKRKPVARDDDDAAPMEDPPHRSTGPKGPPGPPGPIGIPGPPGPIGLCAVPPCGDGPPIGIGPRDTTKRTPDRVTQPVSVVKANAKYAPDPDQRRLSRTKSALMRTHGKGTSSVSFCVSTTGKVVDVRTTKKYPGDPEVDRICREAVAKWRFNPFLADGRPRKTCTTTKFEIEFE